jgi:hypothetical protein
LVPSLTANVMSRVPPVVPVALANVTASKAFCHCATVAVPPADVSVSACVVAL